MKWQARHLDEIEARGGWLPLRRTFGIRAFGLNAWRAQDAGEDVIGEHDEATSGHEEAYVVVAGRARFTVDGEETDAPAGTVVVVHDPAVRRKAVAVEAGTTVLTVGATPGAAFEPMPWEENADVMPLFEAGDYAGARDLLRQVLSRHPNAAGILYNLACAEARVGETQDALAHLARAIELNPPFAELAQTDGDFDAIRTDPRFAGVTSPERAVRDRPA